ncbi:beta-propeller fold lactonase family protein [Streptomyces sp. 6N223]|uniref:beta-propeller fold lactonase family protein n=1 Tax=Streptomyces sp. 6N223 TaxID=3457412 RepID=UPI003FD03D8A
MRLLGHHPCGGSGPRHVGPDAEERWMFVASQDSGSVAVLARDPTTGALTPAGEPAALPAGGVRAPGQYS